MMIGGGGSSCSRGDHGIGITFGYSAFVVKRGGYLYNEYDFGHNAYTKYPPTNSYSLNLWIR